MPKTSTDLTRLALNGSTMGTRWSVIAHRPKGHDPAALHADLQAAVDEVDAQMSVWRPESDLMRLNAAPVGAWVPLPGRLMAVLARALDIGRLSEGAFEIAMGDAVAAWGFGPAPADAPAIRAALERHRQPSFEALELDLAGSAACKRAPMRLDLGGIAKGYGVDRLIEVVQAHGLAHALAAIDGELRALGGQPDGRGWAVALERPEPGRRAAHSVFELRDIAIATSGDYRHFVELGGQRLAHTMDPARGGPMVGGPASVTVLAERCMDADALASAFMVMGEARGRALAARLGVEVLFLGEADHAPLSPEPTGA